MDEMHKHYQILGLKPEASEKEIVETYKVLVKVWQPAQFSDDPNVQKIATEKIKEIDEAFKQLLIGIASHHERGKNIQEQKFGVTTEPLVTPTPSLQEPLYEPSLKPLPRDDLKRSTKQVVVSPHIVEYAGIEEVQNPEISGLQIRPWVRYWARLMDLFLFYLLSGLVLGIIYPPTLKINDMLLMILLSFVYVFVEPIMLTSWGATPGKALLRVRLRKSNGKKPTYLEALGRSVSVWVGGWGLGIPIVSLATLIIAYNKLKKDGITTWDGGRDFNVSHRQIGAIRVIITVLIFISYVFLIVLEEKSKG